MGSPGAAFILRYLPAAPLPGHPWVSMLPPYNEHLVRDVGILALGVAIAVGAAAVFLDARLVNAALFSSAVFFVPHTLWHLNHLKPYGIADIVGQIVVNVVSAVIPLGLLVWNLQPVKQQGSDAGLSWS